MRGSAVNLGLTIIIIQSLTCNENSHFGLAKILRLIMMIRRVLIVIMMSITEFTIWPPWWWQSWWWCPVTITDQSNPDPGKKSDKLLVLLADCVAMVEHHQPAWTCLDFEKDYDDSVKMMIDAHPQIESPSHFIESSFVQFGQLWYMTEHFCKIKVLSLLWSESSPADISLWSKRDAARGIFFPPLAASPSGKKTNWSSSPEILSQDGF